MQNEQLLLSQPHLNIETIEAIAPIVFRSIAVSIGIIFVVIVITRIRLIYVQNKIRQIREKWQPLFLASLYGEVDLKGLKNPRDIRLFLHEWNLFIFNFKGDSRDGMVGLLEKLGFSQTIPRLIRSANIANQILGLVTLTGVKSEKYWYLLDESISSPNSSVSIMAFGAMVEIDPVRAIIEHAKTAVNRDDWTEVTLGKILSKIGQNRIVNVFEVEALSASDENLSRMLRVLTVFRKFDNIEFIREIVTHRDYDPYIVAAAMELMWHPIFVGGMRGFSKHENWVVRKQAAKIFGRLGSQADVPYLVRLVCDNSWWVRYRAAEALCMLPGMTLDMIEDVKHSLDDKYGVDIIDQVLVERGLK